ncbi:hypothetical protein [Lapillicoccus sp.]|uniref:hypothetical protein n=1 Tax=Lapillicoccus sp. TaxID=1909287 RepID=UPI0025D6C9C6|nr:hypothetical protein [Lapillicoccus sp.]
MASRLTTSPSGEAPSWATTREAEHAFSVLALVGSGDVVSAATHFSSSSRAVLVTVLLAGGEVVVLGSRDPVDSAHVRRLHADREGGRLFQFSGSALLEGVMTVGRLVERSAIEDVTMIGHREPAPRHTEIDTQAFVRPHLAGGRVQLVVRPAADGRVVPFEQPSPTPCCADH